MTPSDIPILVVASDQAFQRHLLRNLRVLGYPSTGVSHLAVANLLLELRSFALLLVQQTTKEPPSLGSTIPGQYSMQTVPRIFVGDGPDPSLMPRDVSTDELEEWISDRVDTRGSGNHLPRKPPRVRVVGQLLAFIQRSGVESEADARMAANRTALTSLSLGLSRDDCQRGALSAMLRHTGRAALATWSSSENALDDSIASREIMNAVPSLFSFRDPILCFRERWDGTGTPSGWSGSDIPVLAQVISAIDFYQQCVKDGSTHEEAIEFVEEQATTAFDPEIVKALKKASGSPQWNREMAKASIGQSIESVA